MTKSHILLYVLAVVGITVGAYLYTSTAEAPHALTLDDAAEIIPETPVTETDSVDTLPTISEAEIDILPVSEISAKELTGPTWQWSHTEDLAGQVTFKPKNSQAFKMQFTDSRMSSATDCNTIGGSYDIVGAEFSFGPLMSTLMYCEGSEEAVYNASLSAVSSYEINKDRLLLKNNTGETMVFVSIEL